MDSGKAEAYASLPVVAKVSKLKFVNQGSSKNYEEQNTKLFPQDSGKIH